MFRPMKRRAAARGASRLSRGQAVTLLAIGACVSLAIGVLAAIGARPLAALDHALLDAWLVHTTSGRKASNTVVVDIDEASLAALGQWPWPRYRVAALIERVAAAGPSAIGLDILFPEADRSSLANLQQVFKRDFGVDLAFSGVPSSLLDNDGYLGETMGRHGVVASNYFYFDHIGKAGRAAASGLHFDGRIDRLDLSAASGVLENDAAIAAQTATSGFVNTRLDDDGVLRRLPLLVSHDGVVHANLALAVVMRSLGLASARIEDGANGLDIRIGERRVPIDASGAATLRFNGGPQRYDSVSAVDLLAGKVDARALHGRIVFIGTTAVGLNDLHPTAVDPLFPGLKIQAVAAENLLGGGFVETPRWASAAVFAACVGAGLLVSLLFAASGSVPAIVAGTAALGAAMLAASFGLFLGFGVFVSATAPLLVVAGLFVLFFVVRFAIERRRALVWQRRLDNARQITIESMASVAETRDPETGAHIKRTQHYVRAVAEELRRSGIYTETLSDEFIDLLFLSAPLHDIGKVGVPDHILLKPGRLTPDEMTQMKKHADFGRKIIFSTAERIEGDNFLVVAGDIAASHHEKWDGTGYPLGLAGQAIPLAGRIMAVADIYDALISRRCYKEPFPHALATTLMRENRGQAFDPAVLDAFFRIEAEVKEIAARYKDEAEDVTEGVGSLAAGRAAVGALAPVETTEDATTGVVIVPGAANTVAAAPGAATSEVAAPADATFGCAAPGAATAAPAAIATAG